MFAACHKPLTSFSGIVECAMSRSPALMEALLAVRLLALIGIHMCLCVFEYADDSPL
jgi:hypothetical protein